MSETFLEFYARLACQKRSLDPNWLVEQSDNPDSTKEIILVASAEEKADALSAVLSAGLGTTLVIDAGLAQRVLE